MAIQAANELLAGDEIFNDTKNMSGTLSSCQGPRSPMSGSLAPRVAGCSRLYRIGRCSCVVSKPLDVDASADKIDGIGEIRLIVNRDRTENNFAFVKRLEVLYYRNDGLESVYCWDLHYGVLRPVLYERMAGEEDVTQDKTLQPISSTEARFVLDTNPP